MDFQKMERLNYDLLHIISQRRQQNKNKAFERQMIEGMDKMANLLEFKQYCEEIKEEIVAADEERRNDLALTIQAPSNSDLVNKKTLLEIDIMDIDDENSSKRVKV